MRRGTPGVRRRWFAIVTRYRIVHVSIEDKAFGITKVAFESDDFKVVKVLGVENYELQS